MTTYLTLYLRSSSEPVIKSFDSRDAAVTWLSEVGIPRYGHDIAQIHVD